MTAFEVGDYYWFYIFGEVCLICLAFGDVTALCNLIIGLFGTSEGLSCFIVKSEPQLIFS